MTHPLMIVLSGAPGRMAREIAHVALEPSNRTHFRLAPFAVGAAYRRGQTWDFSEDYTPTLEPVEALPGLLDRHEIRDAIVIDFSLPHCALENLRCFVGADVNFVMGTTGFDRDTAAGLVAGTSVNAVIAPNMAAPIVALQAALHHVANEFPGALEGYELAVRESHQSTKKDPSGTATALLGPLGKLGAKVPEPAMTSIRDAAEQTHLGVPKSFLTAHGWHWYELRSPAGDVALDFSHRVNGRRVYAEGALRAALWLRQRRDAGVYGNAFSMMDVLGKS
jgi:4-hydroxy-tetrahydrodipicolinate reductase